MDSISIQNNSQKQTASGNSDITSTDIAEEMQQRNKAKDELENPTDTVNLSNTTSTDTTAKLQYRATTQTSNNTQRTRTGTTRQENSQPSSTAKKITIVASALIAAVGLTYLLTHGKNNVADTTPQVVEHFDDDIKAIEKSVEKSKKKSKKPQWVPTPLTTRDDLLERCLDRWYKTKSVAGRGLNYTRRAAGSGLRMAGRGCVSLKNRAQTIWTRIWS